MEKTIVLRLNYFSFVDLEFLFSSVFGFKRWGQAGWEGRYGLSRLVILKTPLN